VEIGFRKKKEKPLLFKFSTAKEGTEDRVPKEEEVGIPDAFVKRAKIGVVDLGTGTETAGYRKSFAVQFSHC
jgi:3-dehydroquinate dehydratase